MILVVILHSCSTSPKNESKKSIALERTGKVFPYGVYNHLVEININKSELRQLSSVINYQEQGVSVTGLSLFGNTLFKVQEIDGRIEFEFLIEEFRPFKERFIKIYKIIKNIITLKYSNRNEQDDRLIFSKYDKNNIPRDIKLIEKKYTATIKVKGYKLYE